ncbi:Histone acetyltransferase KAT7 [Eufriesea mexicana]|uniref:Histone acetyltransferase n=1 Tax=Eufriesea mexicana TaxID=516756 RepID=A0A310SUC1_9HYME|nr:Histone acetyltransferase KAT7 [Eufriesea mexicana]
MAIDLACLRVFPAIQSSDPDGKNGMVRFPSLSPIYASGERRGREGDDGKERKREREVKKEGKKSTTAGYLLTRVEKKIGSPEKPLSDLGLISYRSYWKDVLLQYLCNFGGKELSVKDISKEMAIDSYDIVSTLQALGMMKYWKGKHIILKKQRIKSVYRFSVRLVEVFRYEMNDFHERVVEPSCLGDGKEKRREANRWRTVEIISGRDRRLQGEGEETRARLQRDRSGVSEMEPLPASQDALRLELRLACSRSPE